MKKLYLFLALIILCATAVAQECNQPEWPESDIINETTVRVHWPAVAGAQFYRLYHYDGDGNLLLSTTTTDTAYTFTGFGKHNPSRIDHIFVRGWQVEQFRTLNGDYGVPYISDHYPIEVVLRFSSR